MVYENIQIEHGNFTISRDGSSFFTLDHENTRLIEKNSSGTVIFSYFLDKAIFEVQALQFDGVYFWSLERQSSVGFRIRRWEIGEDDLVRAIDEYSFIDTASTPYDVYTMAVEYYSDSLDGNALVSDTEIDVNDGSVVRIGDEIVIGPSTAVGYEGEFATVTVLNKVGNTLTISPALDVSFSPNEEIYFTRNFYVFSDDAFGGLKGSLYKFKASNGALLALDTSNLYNLVRASTFFKEVIMFVRGGEIIWLDPASFNITKSQAIDTLDENRTTYIDTFDLAGYDDSIYRLEQEHIFFDSTWQTEDWSPLYNYNTSNTVSEIYFVALKADPPELHKSVVGLPTVDRESKITVHVFDQFRTPVSGRTVDFSSDGGSLSPIQDTTDANGTAKTTYTSDTSVGEVAITADVS